MEGERSMISNWTSRCHKAWMPESDVNCGAKIVLSRL